MPRKKKIDELVVIELLKQAKGKIDDPIEVNRLLREVGKFFDVLTGGAMIDGGSRHRIVTLVERGEKAEALAAIDRFIETYQKVVEPEAAPKSPADQPSSSCAA